MVVGYMFLLLLSMKARFNNVWVVFAQSTAGAGEVVVLSEGFSSPLDQPNSTVHNKESIKTAL